MSSTLFGRGVNTQVGLARRNQEMTKSIAFAVAAAESVKALPDEVQFMKSQIVALERRLAATEAKLEQAILDKKATESFSSSTSS
jgi:hypothetical protein